MQFNETLMTFVRKDLEQGLIPMLLGEPGIGKSSWLENLAVLMHTKVFTLACNQLADKADLTGARLVPVTQPRKNADGTITEVITGYKQMFYPHAVIYDAIEYAKANPRETPILFLDELNRTTPDVTSEALSIPTMRSIGSVKLPDNLRVVIAGNDKGNVTSLDEASISRFVLYHTDPDVNTFLSLDKDLNPFVKATLTAHPDCIFCKKSKVIVKGDDDDDQSQQLDIDDILEDGDDMAQITTPRTLMGLSKWLNSFTRNEIVSLLATSYIVDGEETNALQEGIEGHVGKTDFTTYLIAEIANNIATVQVNSLSTQVGKPACYDELKSKPDMTALTTFVSTMTDNEKSGCLLYALYEKDDNRVVIQALAPSVTKLESADMKTLMQLSSNDQLDYDNTQVLISGNTAIAQSLSVILTFN